MPELQPVTTHASSDPLTIVWFRRDLRVADHPALHAAAARGRVRPVYIDEPEGPWATGAAARYWLHQSLAAHAAELATRGAPLVLRRGAAHAVLDELVATSGADAVYWIRRYEPHGMACDADLKRRLGARCEVRSFQGHVLFEPHTVATANDTPYRVFTPFHKACLARGEPPPPLPAPARLVAPDTTPSGLALAALGLEPRRDWAGGIRAAWTFGERAACARLEAFVDGALVDYPVQRDYPDVQGVSGLSPHLAFGELSARSAWHEVRAAQAAAAAGVFDRAADAWLRQLTWREFAYHLLYHYPHTIEAPLREDFAALPWVDDAPGLAAWTRGATGFPLVDAGMRELWATGYMHNRVRMLTASFLTKHLGVHWLAGARWFWDTLVDADLANNTLGWQWVAGCGADAAPYFRIFNPHSQSRKFDPAGNYLRRWLPPLAALGDDAIHVPTRTTGYPAPLVDLKTAREAALARYAQMRR
ncbi:MAG: deoxyribodipyrimidine photo-lyase [Gammaproteobacteria bacterium]